MNYIVESNSKYKKTIDVLKDKITTMEKDKEKQFVSIVKMLEDQALYQNEINARLYDYEDFLFEFKELVESLMFVAGKYEHTDESNGAFDASILRLLRTNFISSYNNFSHIGEVIFSTTFAKIEK